MSAVTYNRTPVYRCQLVREGSVKTTPSLTSNERAAKVAREYLSDSPCEQVIVLLLDMKNRVIGVAQVTTGTLDSSLLHAREFFRPAILANAASVIMAHNHPSGIVDPSPEDRAITAKVRTAGGVLGIDVLDSLIVGEDEVYSLVTDSLILV